MGRSRSTGTGRTVSYKQKVQRPPKPKQRGRGKRPAQRGPLGFLALAGAFAVAWGVGAWSFFQGRSRKRVRDAGLLLGMRRRPLHTTEHAACRMGCRFVSKEDVAQTLREGRVNDRKSVPDMEPCAKYVVDSKVGRAGAERKNIQVVFSACPDRTDVVTVIDRDTNWECYCP